MVKLGLECIFGCKSPLGWSGRAPIVKQDGGNFGIISVSSA
jgi:hypothetical protein